MGKLKPRRLFTWFLIIAVVLMPACSVSAAQIQALSKTVSPTPNADGELDLALTLSGETVTQNQPLNLLLVIDLSSSMGWDLSGENHNPGAESSRLGILKRALAGSDTNFIDTLAAKVGAGNLNVDLVTFGTSASNTLDWTDDLETVKSTIHGLRAYGGTNYQQALEVASDAAAARSDVHVIFLSDGHPTFYGSSAQGTGNSCSMNTLEATLGQMEEYARDSNLVFRGAIAYATDPSFVTDRAGSGAEMYRYSDVNLLGPAGAFASGVYQSYAGWPYGYWTNGPQEMNLDHRQIPAIGSDACQSANNEDELLDSLNAIVQGFNLSQVSITDPMHQRLIQANCDLEHLYANGKLNVYLLSADGTQTELSEGSDFTVSGDTLQYLPELRAGETLKAVAKVPISDTPGEIYFREQAHPDTDAQGNTGFFSNGSASAYGLVHQEAYTGVYANPVFELNTTRLTLRKINAADSSQNLPGASFTIERLPYNGLEGEAAVREETYTTGQDGTVVFENLPYGNYRLTETASPSGFKLLETPLTFSVDYLGRLTSEDSRLQSLSGSSEAGYTADVANVPNDVTLTVTKNLKGTARNLSDTFPFTLSVTDYPDYVSGDQIPQDVTQSLGQGEHVSLTVPWGTTVSVAETDSKGYAADVDQTSGQSALIPDWGPEGDGYAGRITLTADTSVMITNTKDAPAVTGFVTRPSGAAGIFLAGMTVAALGAVRVFKRRLFSR